MFYPLTSVWSARLAMTDIGEMVFFPALAAAPAQRRAGLDFVYGA